MNIEFTLNEEKVSIQANPQSNLSMLLREYLGIQSVHDGCRQGFCGQCIVLMDNQAVPSCLVSAHSVRGAVIETAEGLITLPGFVDLEKAFLQASLNPCPHCAGNKAVLAESILRNNTELDEARIQSSMPQHWCACSSINDFVTAVLAAHLLRKTRRINAT